MPFHGAPLEIFDTLSVYRGPSHQREAHSTDNRNNEKLFGNPRFRYPSAKGLLTTENHASVQRRQIRLNSTKFDQKSKIGLRSRPSVPGLHFTCVGEKNGN